MTPVDSESPRQRTALAFVHIPKAGGTTLHRILDRQYPRGSIVRCDIQIPGVRERMDALTPQQRQQALCIRGHMPYGVHAYIERPTRYITMLRDPVQRFVSKYKNLKRTPQRALDLNFPAEDVGTLEEFVELQIQRNAMNFQTRLLAGCLDLADPLPPFAPLPPDALDRALRNIERDFVVVGLMERFDESLVLMKRALGWGGLRYARQNVAYRGMDPRAVPSAIETRIRELNHLDEELYRRAAAELERRIAEAGPGFAEEVARTRRTAARIHALQKVYNRQPLKGLRRLASRVLGR